MADTRKIGKIGEEKAGFYLESDGYQLLEANYRNGRGEIDLIAIKDGLLVFVEVKTRAGLRSYLPAVHWYQRKKIVETAHRYLSNYYWEGQIRYDVIEVFLNGTGEIRHHQGEFGQL